jgi:hypothetical protein
MVGILSFAATYAGITLAMPLPFLGDIVLFMIDYGIFFLAAMVFLWKMSETQGYTLGLANQFDKKKYLICVLIGTLANLALALLLLPIPIVNFIPVILNYYFVFPQDLIFDNTSIPEIFSMYIAFFIDTPILFAVMFFGACSGDKYGTYIRESTKNETDFSELSTEERKPTPRKPGTSWRDSIK